MHAVSGRTVLCRLQRQYSQFLSAVVVKNVSHTHKFIARSIVSTPHFYPSLCGKKHFDQRNAPLLALAQEPKTQIRMYHWKPKRATKQGLNIHMSNKAKKGNAFLSVLLGLLILRLNHHLSLSLLIPSLIPLYVMHRVISWKRCEDRQQCIALR